MGDQGWDVVQSLVQFLQCAVATVIDGHDITGAFGAVLVGVVVEFINVVTPFNEVDNVDLIELSEDGLFDLALQVPVTVISTH